MEKWRLKEVIKIILRCFIAFTIFFSMLMIYSDEGINIETFKKFLFPMLQIIVGFLGILFFIYIITEFKKRKSQIKSDDYYRDIVSEITPAMGALIIDKYLEKNETILATILDLHVRKYFDIKKENDKLEIEVLNKNIDTLYLHEKYVIESIVELKKINRHDFNRLVQQDCISSDYTKCKNVEPIYIIIACFMIWGIILYPALEDSILNHNIIKFVFISLFSILIIFFPVSLITMGPNRTNKGDEMAKKLKELKNFLKEYTLLNDRDINYLNLADRYMPFALALGEAKKLENLYVENNDLISKYIDKEENI